MLPSLQLQIGLWLTTWHLAFNPQVPGQGSMHLLFKHACCKGHSALTIHSGLHDGGLPLKPGWQEQTGIPLLILHILFGPQGDGWQGFLGGSVNNNVSS